MFVWFMDPLGCRSPQGAITSNAGWLTIYMQFCLSVFSFSYLKPLKEIVRFLHLLVLLYLLMFASRLLLKNMSSVCFFPLYLLEPCFSHSSHSLTFLSNVATACSSSGSCWVRPLAEVVRCCSCHREVQLWAHSCCGEERCMKAPKMPEVDGLIQSLTKIRGLLSGFSVAWLGSAVPAFASVYLPSQRLRVTKLLSGAHGSSPLGCWPWARTVGKKRHGPALWWWRSSWGGCWGKQQRAGWPEGGNGLRKWPCQNSAHVLCILVSARECWSGNRGCASPSSAVTQYGCCCGDCLPPAPAICLWLASPCLHAVWQPRSLGMDAASRCRDEDSSLEESPPCQRRDSLRGPPWLFRSTAEEGSGLQPVGSAGRRRLSMCVRLTRCLLEKTFR